MEKEKFGLTNKAIAIISFVLVALNQPLALLLVVGFALLVRKDERLIKQCVQGLLLNLFYCVIILLFNTFIKFFTTIFDWTDAYKAISIFLGIQSAISLLLQIILIVLCLISIIKILANKDVKLPVFNKIVDNVFSKQEQEKTNGNVEVQENTNQEETKEEEQ